MSHSSHSDVERKAVKAIKGLLERLGFEQVFLDFDKDTGIDAGEDWERRLYRELSRCHAIILVLTPSWVASKWCFVELTQARALGKIILPIKCAPLDSKVLPQIHAVNLLDLNAGGLKQLEKSLRAISNDLARGFTLDPSRIPYPGIHSFEYEDAAIYFGRDQEAFAVIERLDSRRTQGGARFLVVIGASGSGKSSLLKAGVLPQLARRPADWNLLPAIRPERTPLETLAKVLAQHVGKPDTWGEAHEKLKGPDAVAFLHEVARTVRVGRALTATLLLPIDQFEEVFTIATPEERDGFLRLLIVALGRDPPLPLMIVATGRSDVLQGLLEAGDLARLYETFPLAAMPLDRLPRLIEGPALVAGLNVENGLCQLISQNVESADALPLLAYTLRLLYRLCVEERKERELTIQAYSSLGDPERKLNPIQNSVRRAADQAIAGFHPTPEELDALRDAFIPHLVRVRLDDGRRVRQPALLSELPVGSRRLVRALIEARLLSERTGDKDRSEDESEGEGDQQFVADTEGAETGQLAASRSIVEVSHEALFKAWPTLDQWLTDEHDFLADIERIKGACEVWEKAAEDQKGRALLTGLLLARARTWRDRYPDRFRGREMRHLRSFVDASADAEDAAQAERATQAARARRLRQRLTYGTSIAAVVFAIIAVVAGWQFVQAEHARKRALASESNARVSESRARENESRARENEAKARENESKALANEAKALENESRILINRARQLHVEGDQGSALALALRALTDRDSGAARPYLPEAESILYQSLVDLRERQVLKGHQELVWSAAFSPHGRRVVTASYDNTARIWDAATGAGLATLNGHTNSLTCATFSPDGRRVVTASWDRTARIWDAGTGTEIAALKHEDIVNTAVYSPDGRYILTASDDRTARLWNAKTGQELFRFKHGDIVKDAAFSVDGRFVVTASGDKTAAIWDVKTGALLHKLIGHEGLVSTAAFSPDGRLIVTGSYDRTARIWEAATGRLLWVLPEHPEVVLTAVFSPDSQRVLTSTKGTARLWDVLTRTELKVLQGHANWVVSASFSPDGKQILTASGDKTARIWDTETGAELLVLRGHEDWIHSAAFSPDGRHVVTASLDKTARIWDAVGSAAVTVLRGHQEMVTTAIFTSDGQYAITGSDDKTVRVWNLKTGESSLPLGDSDASVVSGVAVSRDGKRVATADDKAAYVWDIKSGKRLATFKRHTERIVTIDISSDGQRVVTASWDKTARIWDAETGRQIAKLEHDDKVEDANFSPDGKNVVTASQDNFARIWDAETGAPVALLRGHEGWVICARYSSDSRFIVTASLDRTARVWTATGVEVAKLEGHDQELTSASFSPNGRLVVTASADSTARIWDALTGAQRGEPLQGHTYRVMDANFSPNGRFVVTASLDKTARIWNVETGKEIAILRGHDGGVREAVFSHDGKHVMTASEDKTARIWPVFASTHELIERAREVMPPRSEDLLKSLFLGTSSEP